MVYGTTHTYIDDLVCDPLTAPLRQQERCCGTNPRLQACRSCSSDLKSWSSTSQDLEKSPQNQMGRGNILAISRQYSSSLKLVCKQVQIFCDQNLSTNNEEKPHRTSPTTHQKIQPWYTVHHIDDTHSSSFPHISFLVHPSDHKGASSVALGERLYTRGFFCFVICLFFVHIRHQARYNQ